MHTLETDYLIVGSGAMGMAFADVLLNETSATMVIVDRHHRAGGHWNDAYSFVRLHQPSTRYGVNSKKLGNDQKDLTGLNKGLEELATGPEILSYFDQVMQQQLLPSGRVNYFPMCNYTGNKEFTSLVSGDSYRVTVRKRIVDTTFVKLAVPSTHPPEYEVAPGVECVPLNQLPRISRPHSGYVVIGSGKTGIDACLWLLESGASPESIQWIMPRDAWYLDRANSQSGLDSIGRFLESLNAQMDSIVEATSVDDLLVRLEASGQLLRFDERITPTMYRCATVTRSELEVLRKIKNVVRLGRVQAIERDRIVLQKGSISADPRKLYVNCSAIAFKQTQPIPIFAGDTITPQCVRTCQPIFSAALIAHVEAKYGDDAEKNRLCSVVPLPEQPIDWLRMLSITMDNHKSWAQHEEMRRWLVGSRLDGASATFQSVKESDTEKYALMQRYRGKLGAAAAKLKELLAHTS